MGAYLLAAYMFLFGGAWYPEEPPFPPEIECRVGWTVDCENGSGYIPPRHIHDDDCEMPEPLSRGW